MLSLKYEALNVNAAAERERGLVADAGVHLDLAAADRNPVGALLVRGDPGEQVPDAGPFANNFITGVAPEKSTVM